MKTKPLTLTQRARLAHEVFDKVFNAVEAFRANNLGADVCYLLGAILDDPDKKSFVDWSEPIGTEFIHTRRLFRKLFPRNHPVWQFIVTQ